MDLSPKHPQSRQDLHLNKPSIGSSDTKLKNIETAITQRPRSSSGSLNVKDERVTKAAFVNVEGNNWILCYFSDEEKKNDFLCSLFRCLQPHFTKYLVFLYVY